MSIKVVRVLIDPGHGPGCVNGGRHGYKEHSGMYMLSTLLKAELEARGVRADLTREANADPSLNERGKMAAGYDLFVSEHSNAGGNGKARGVEVFRSVDLPDDKAFAAAMSKALADVMGNPDRGAKVRPSDKDKGEDYYTVIDAAQDAGCPHVLLIENGFHDNIADEAFLLDYEGLKELAKAQADVICKYLNVKVQDYTGGPDGNPVWFNLVIGGEATVVPGEYIENTWWITVGDVRVKVRDVLDVFGFAVAWDGVTRTITGKGK